MKLGLFIILFVIIFGGSYIVTNKLNGTSAYVDETAQLVKDNQDDVVSRLEAKEQGMYYFGFPTCPWCVELLPVLDKENYKQTMVKPIQSMFEVNIIATLIMLS